MSCLFLFNLAGSFLAFSCIFFVLSFLELNILIFSRIILSSCLFCTFLSVFLVFLIYSCLACLFLSIFSIYLFIISSSSPTILEYLKTSVCSALASLLKNLDGNNYLKTFFHRYFSQFILKRDGKLRQKAKSKFSKTSHEFH